MTNRELHDLLESFGQEQACYTALLDLSRRQKEIIEGGDVDQLLALLGQKQQVLERITGIEEQLAPYKRDWRHVQDSLDDDDRQVLDLALATVEELLSELIALERESEQLLVSRRDRTYDELRGAAHASAVNSAYLAPQGAANAQYLDIRSE